MKQSKNYDNKTKKVIFNIIISFIISFLFIWITGYEFCNSLLPYTFDHTLKRYIHQPNIIYKHRTEGWAETYKGKYGINAIKDITKDHRQKIIIWGDSYVEAHQVNDPQKVSQVVTSLLKQASNNNLMCFAVGMSGDSVADYYFYIPKYERLADSVRAHFIIITDIRDTMPDQSTDTERGLFKSNPYRLVYEKRRPKFQQLKRMLNKYGLYFIWAPIKSALPRLKNLRFIPTIHKKLLKHQTSKKTKANAHIVDAWNFLLKKIREQTNLPIIFVYCPIVPAIKNGKISFIDQDYNKWILFSKIASKYHIQSIDVIDDFIQFYKTTGRLPRGFPNSRPGMGHFNAAGHRLVAKAIVKYIKKNMKLEK